MIALPMLLPMASLAQPAFILKDSTKSYRLDDQVSVFVDPTDTTTLSTVIQPGFQGQFIPHHSNLTFGYLKAAIWLKISVASATAKTRWYLEIPAPFLEYVDFYQLPDSGKWIHNISGYYRPQSQRSIKHTGHVMELHFGHGNATTVFIKISGESPKTFPVYAIERGRFTEKTRWEDVGYGIFFGILIVMFFYNLFIYLTIRETNYLLYISTIVCTFLIFGSASGYAGRFLWPEHASLNFYAGRMTLGILAAFMALFTIRFLSVKLYSPPMYFALLSLVPLGPIACFLVASNILSSAGNNLITMSAILYMTAGIVCRMKGNRFAGYFIAAWSIYLSGGLLLTLRNSGFFNFNFWTTHFVEIGAALETIIIAFALADQYRRLRKEKEEVQLLALKLQREATGKLELKVQQRTQQLSKANDELQGTLEKNNEQTRIIEDKNAELDAFFYRISHDLKGPIASMLGLCILARMDIEDEKALTYIDQQHSQINRLNHIITSLVNLTQLNHADMGKQTIDFAKMIEECIESLRALPNHPLVHFKQMIDPGIEFNSEWALVNGIVQNLIENAIKYSQRNSPYVFTRVFQDANFVFIEVQDNGQGIPHEHQGRIFEMFFRATQNASGTGLGLYILKRSVDRLRGTVFFKSTPGVGSTFTVKLPLITE
jgi:signal transduction histidine kinase